MKIVKILLIFIAVALGIYGLSWLKSVFDGGGEKPGTTNYIDVNDMCNDIRQSWKEESDWNPNLFRTQLADIKQKNKMKRFESQSDFEAVTNALRESATNCLQSAIFREFHSKNCNDKKVKDNYQGVETLLASFAMDKDSRIQKIQNTKRVYDEISSFINRAYRITARYDASNNSWVSFDTQKNNIISTAAKYRNKAIYQDDLSSIDRFIKGLTDSYIRTEIEKQKTGFYHSLSRQIINHFKDAELTQENLNRFNNLYAEYCDETDLFVSEIATLLRDFRERYEIEEEKRKENAFNL